MDYRCVLRVLVVLLLIAAGSAWAFHEPFHERLPGVDRRKPQPAVEGSVKATAATSKLHQRLPGARIERHELLGSPKLIMAADGLLTGPGGKGRAVPEAALKALAPNDPHRPVKAFVAEYPDLFGHGPEALVKARLARESVNPRGLRTLVWEQRIDSVPVFEGVFVAHVTEGGELVSISSQFLPDPETATGMAPQKRAALVAQPPVTAAEALDRAAADLGQALHAAGIEDLGEQPGTQRRTLRSAGLRGLAYARLLWLPLNATDVRLCWEVHLAVNPGGETYRSLVDATSGEVWVRHSRTFYLTEATFRVFTTPSPAPMTPALPTPATNQAPKVEREWVSLAALSTNASLAGWIGDRDNETRGNNVDAYLDRDANDAPDGERPQGSPFRVFDFPMDLTQAPETHGQASVVQLFYWCNWMHDRLYELGFDEAAGNFQKDNFGRGGLDGDPVMAEAQDGSGMNNANFSIVADGISPRMQMYRFDGPDPNRDGALDADIVLHEYTHGLTDRLVGGGVGIYQHQTLGLAEGWSDFYALCVQRQPHEDPDATYTEGAYSTWLYFGLKENYYYGIRRYPYSTDLAKNPLTFKDIDPAQISSHPGVPLNPIYFFDPKKADLPHRMGEVWCMALWEARANLIRKHGFALGNPLILQLVTDGLKLSPPNPTFLQARDAILLADRLRTGGANQRELWTAFAKRGMGLSAVAPSSASSGGVREAFDYPDAMVITPALPITFFGPVGGPFTPACRELQLTNAAAQDLTWAVGGAEPYLRLSTSAGTLAAGESVAIAVCPLGPADTWKAGLQTVTLFFSNVTSRLVQRRDVKFRIITVATMPVVEDFEAPTLSGAWTVSGLGATRVRLMQEESPHGGLGHLVFDSHTAGQSARNELTLAVDLAGYTNVVLRFWAKSLNDRPDGPPPIPVTEPADYDGVAVSADGVAWYEVTGLRRLQGFYQEVIVDLDAAIASYGLAYSDLFFIRINHAGNRPVPEQGIAIDDLSLTGIAPLRLVVSLPTSGLEGADLLDARVSLGLPVSSNVVVALESRNPVAAIVPDTVVIPAGAREAAFPIELVDDTALDGPTRVQVHASAPGYARGVAEFEVRDDEFALLFLQVPGEIPENSGTLVGQIQSSAPADYDVIVSLTSSDPDEIWMPPAVVLPSGQTNVTFQYNVINDSRLDGSRTVMLTASAAGWPVEQVEITIQDDEGTYLAVSLPPLLTEASLTYPNTGLVWLSGSLPTNLTVTLTSSLPGRLTVPASVVIPAGRINQPFNVTVLDDTVLQGSQKIIVAAATPGFVTGVGETRLLDNEMPPEPYDPQPAHRSSHNPVELELAWSLGVSEVLQNGGFEEGSLTGWKRRDTADGGFVLNNGTLDPPGPEGRTPPLTGSFAVTSIGYGPGRHELYQDVLIPLHIASATLNWTDRVRNHAGVFSEDQYYRVEIRDLANQVLIVLYSTEPGDPALGDWREHSYDLQNYRGQTIRIAFVAEDQLGFLNAHLDRVRIMLIPAPGTVNEVYFGTRPLLGSADLAITTSNTSWRPPALALDTTYYWRVVALQGSLRQWGPVWQFHTRGIGELHHFEWQVAGAQQVLDEPFTVTVSAKDDVGTTLTNWSGNVWLNASRPVAADTVQVLVFNAYPGFGREFRNTLGAIASTFTNFSYTTLTNPEPEVLATRLVGQDVLLVVEQEQTPAGRMAELGAAWAAILNEFVSRGGVVMVCSYNKDEHRILEASGLLEFEKVLTTPVGTVMNPGEDALAAGVPPSFNAGNFSSYEAINAQVVLRDAAGHAVVIRRAVGEGHVILIGTDFAVPRTGLDRVLANAVRLAQGPATEPVPLSPGWSEYFLDGQWTGLLRLHAPGERVVLEAYDGAGHAGTSFPITVVAENDLAVTVHDAPDPATVGSPVTYTIQVTNSGPAAAAGVVLTNALPDDVMVLDLLSSQGECMVTNGQVVCELGELLPRTAALIELMLLPLSGGRLTTDFIVARAGEESFLGNNSATANTRVFLPAISIADVRVDEGNDGVTLARFDLRLTPASPSEVSCSFALSNITASVGVDYAATNGVIVFPPGVTNQQLNVLIYGDDRYESGETFQVNLSDPVQAILLDAQAFGIIQNDDPLPRLEISGPATVTEGAVNVETPVTINARLSAPAGVPVEVQYGAVPGSAVAGRDFLPAAGQLRLEPGETNATLRVTVLGDFASETNESFTVRFSNPQNVELASPQIEITILDDDAGQLDYFTFGSIAATQQLHQPFPVHITGHDGFGAVADSFTGPVTLTGFRNAGTRNVGDGAENWEYPLTTGFHDARVQTIYLASEVGEAARITALALRVDTPPGRALERWTIRLKHTPLSAYSQAAWDSSGWTTVFQQTEIILDAGWVSFPFTIPFDFNGVDNLLVDLSFNNTAYATDGRCRYSLTPEPRTLAFRTDSAFGDPLLWGGADPTPVLTQRRPDIRLSLETAVAITPEGTGQFTNGAWTGSIAADEVTSGLTVRAADGQGHFGYSAPFAVTASNDLQIAVVDLPDPVRVGDPLTYYFTITNPGPARAEGVRFTNALPATVEFVSAQTSVGACSNDAGVVWCDLGPLEAQASFLVSVVVIPRATGLVTNQAAFTRADADAFLANNVAFAVTRVQPPALSISDATVQESTDALTTAVFNIFLSGVSREPISVRCIASSGTASNLLDFLPPAELVVFPPGVSNQTVLVPIVGDIINEREETFFLSLTNATNAIILDGQGTGTILDDDPVPVLTVLDAQRQEGNQGSTLFQFPMILSGPSGQRVSVSYTVASGTALVGEDFQNTSTTISMLTGSTNRFLNVIVFGDRQVEPDEFFTVQLRNPVNATLATTSVVGRIINDDSVPGVLDHFDWQLVPSPQYVARPFDVVVTARDFAGDVVRDFSGVIPLSGRLGQPDVNLGDGAVSWDLPLGAGAHDARTQVFYPAAEIGGARQLVGLALKVNVPPGQPLNRWTIRLKHTERTTLSSVAFDTNGWITVLQTNTSINSTGWVTWPFATLFAYNGTSNLMVEFSFDNAYFTFDGECAATAYTQARAIYARSDSQFGDPLNWAGAASPPVFTSTKIPALRLLSGFPVAIQPNITPAFTEGVWRGQVQVLEPAEDMFLQANPGSELAGVSTTFSVLDIPDLDQDGLVDQWELTHFGSLNDPDGAPEADPDHDGHTNLQEQIAGTNPRQPASVLAVQSIEFDRGNVRIRFSTAKGLTYQVERADYPGAGWTSLGGPLQGTGAPQTIIDPGATSLTNRFYRIRMQ